MRIGVDGRKFPQATALGPIGVLDAVHRLGYEGVFFRTVLDLSPELDAGRLREIRQRADDLGLYFEVGLGKVNPYNTPEIRDVRQLGRGDYRLGMERMIRACHAIGCTELWGDIANYQGFAWGLYAIDRFRTDTTWPDQLEATAKFLRRLAPLLRELGCHLNLETHEEVTTRELSQLVESVGPDVAGVTLDLANVVVRGEEPLAATRRVAPYVRQTHIRDVVLRFVPEGLERQVRACGDGIIDWRAVLSELRRHNPRLNLSIEEAKEGRNTIQLYDRAWLAADPGLSVGELMDLVRHAYGTEQRIARGEIPAIDAYFTGPYGVDERLAFIRRCADHLRAVSRELDAAEGGVGQLRRWREGHQA